MVKRLELRMLLSGWPMSGRDIWNTNRADFIIPDSRLGSSFFDIFAWQTVVPGSPADGTVGATAMTFFDGAGPGGTDIVLGAYHWPKGAQGMDRHTGHVFWYGNTNGDVYLAGCSASGSPLWSAPTMLIYDDPATPSSEDQAPPASVWLTSSSTSLFSTLLIQPEDDDPSLLMRGSRRPWL